MVWETVHATDSMRREHRTMTTKRSCRGVCPTGTAPHEPQSTWAHAPGAQASVRKAACLRGRTVRPEALTREEPPAKPRSRRRWTIWVAEEGERSSTRIRAGVHGARVREDGRGVRGRQGSWASQWDTVRGASVKVVALCVALSPACVWRGCLGQKQASSSMTAPPRSA